LGEPLSKGETISLDTAFFRDLSSATLDALSEYYRSMESQLSSLKTGERARIARQVDKLALTGDEEYQEYNLAMQDYEAKYEMLFTNFFRFSDVTLLALALEDWMAKLCRVVHDIKKLPGAPPIPGNKVIATYKAYLTKAHVFADKGLWEGALDLYSVRNCIVHNSGNVSRSRYKQQIEALALKTRGIQISGQHRDREAIPLYLEDGMLIIDAVYCESATEEVKALFGQLCDAVPLHRIRFR